MGSKYFYLVFSVLPVITATAQDSTATSAFAVSGYVETYYVYDFNKPENNTRPSFIYAYNRHNEVNLNLGFIKGSYSTDRVRANLAVMTGTYSNANLASEPGVLKNIYEAYTGVKISAKKNLWVDAGIFPSHIGFESAVGKDCWTLTRSIMADNSPYYEAGAKISYTSRDEKWFLSALLLNGWQRIQRVDGKSRPSVGTQVTLKPSTHLTLNSSTFIGSDKSNTAQRMRYFQDFYAIITITPKVSLTAAFDYGWQERSDGTKLLDRWYAQAIIARYCATKKLSVAGRIEYYADNNGVIIFTGTPHNFKAVGASVNVDYQIISNAVWRIEARSLNSKDAVFTREVMPVKNDFFLSTCLAVSF